jgi:hydroxyacylglutathione hydrolase
MSIQIRSLPLGPIQTNCFIVADEATKDAAVIDPGWAANKIVDVLDERGWTLRAVLLTHAHFDHIGGVADLLDARPAPLALHSLDVPLLRAKGGADLFGLPMRACPEPDVLLDGMETVRAGSLTFRVLFVPGHTLGHVAFHLPEARAVFSGDVLFKDSIGRTDLPGGDYATLLHSIRAVLCALPDDTTVCSGHGPQTTLGEEKKYNPFLAD